MKGKIAAAGYVLAQPALLLASASTQLRVFRRQP